MTRHEHDLELMKKYTACGLNFIAACTHGDAGVLRAHFAEKKAPPLNENMVYSMPPGFPQMLPLAAAVLSGSKACVELLLVHGADPDIRCRRCEKTPRELAENTALAELFATSVNNDRK